MRLLQNAFYTSWVLMGALAMLLPNYAPAAPVSPDRAGKVAAAWARSSQQHLGKQMNRTIQEVKTFNDANGEDMFHVILLDMGGFVVVPADDEVEPIIAFSSDGTLEEDPENPLWSLVSQDLPSRIEATRSLSKRALQTGPSERQEKNRKKWLRFESLTDLQSHDYSDEPLVDMGTPSINDECVSPLVASRWNQGSVGYPSVPCYNYYTPNHYVSGCVATAMAQVIRYWQHPTSGIGVHSYNITVDGVAQSASTRGGDGAGGAYDWSLMTLVPTGSTPEAARQMIGALLYDCGVSVEMEYASGGSGASTYYTSLRLKDRFGYANSIYTQGTELTTDGLLNRIVNPNLDFGSPTILSIRNDKGEGHAIIADGYGYNSSTLYHHLNMGWGGSQDAWYNLPNVDDAYYGFSKVQAAVYNIFVSGTGEIISGRVLNHDGTPASGISVTATASGSSYPGVTNDRGIYAIKVPIPSSTASYSVSCAGAAAPVSAQVGRSGFSVCGNAWGADLSLSPPNTPPKLNAIGNMTIQAGQTITFTIDAYDPDTGQIISFSATGQ
ncbi:MAG: C10 family peptidase [Opitutales bacterium]|nr:C10 family peptidase [Opitutales bacterium]